MYVYIYQSIIMTKTLCINFILFFLLTSFTSQAQVVTGFNNVEFNESLLSVQKKISAISSDVVILEITTPNFPLSEKKEEHLIASMVGLDSGTLDKVVFTFSDDKLCYIQAKGNVVKTIASIAKSEAKRYLDYTVYESDLIFINNKKDLAWQLTPESVHPNLFTWDNPYLYTKNEIKYEPSVKIPEFIKMGGNIDDLTPFLKSNSLFIQVQKLEKKDSITKTQINCFGVEYAGFPRKFEARFENGELNMVWILTGKGEENRLRKKLTEEYGKAVFVNDDWEVFNNWTVLLRKDKPEILLLTQELGLMYKKQYSK